MTKDWHAISKALAVRQYEVLFYMKNGTQCDIDLVDGADTIMVAESVSRRGLTSFGRVWTG